ncbi:hypothetical protein BKA61DRAFT_683703 [Leptodontidium sp. MPI-SDFR-AT-0119]|nr:hypothetical protein BKA61DRAFT_683703 [Leptodontidium sp. MPI-SDFR-AT-0119]
MAPTETAGKPKQPEPPKVDDKPETAQNPSLNPSTADHLQQTTGRSSNLTDTDMEETLRATPSSLDRILEEVSKETPVVDERK